jgi:hemolysin III
VLALLLARAARKRLSERTSRSMRRGASGHGTLLDVTLPPKLKSLPSPRMPKLLSSGPIKPKLRGVFHQYAFFVSVACGVGLIATAHAGLTRWAAAAYAAAVSGLLGTSALYHRVTWRPHVGRWMRRLDHSMIFVLIAATYTPVALVALSGTLPRIMLIVVWTGALIGALMKVAWIDAPKGLFAILYLALGWSTVAVFGQLPAAIGWLGAAGFALGGMLYTGGAIVYATGRPDPAPRVFGYHEIFHVLVVVAVAMHYAVIAFLVLPRG